MKKFVLLLILISFGFTFKNGEEKKNNNILIESAPKSDVFMQGFYWNSPPGGIWYDSLAKLAPMLSSAGFSAIWFPSPVKGNGGGFSMGYDPYDHFDFGEFFQKGSRETRFGSRSELRNAIQTFKNLGIKVFADAVLNHMNGGEELIPYECKPFPSFPDSAYLLFNYPNGSGRFKKNASHFYPNLQTCDVNPPYHGADDPLFQFGEWLAHDRSFVRDSLIVWGKYLKEVLGFEGFRIDAVKGIDPAFMGPWLQQVNNDGAYAVAELWGSISEIGNWLHQTKNIHGGNVSMFDFPLRYTLQDMCSNTDGSFNMNFLDGAGLINNGISGFDVATFVENHDFDRIGWDGSVDNGHNPIISDKHLAYAYIIFSEGRPSVFFKDYFEYGFKGTIDTLIWIRRNFLGGGTTKRGGLEAYYIRQDGNENQSLLSQDIYVARRNGFGSQIGGYLIINDNPSQWIDVWVDTELPVGSVYRDFTGKDVDKTVVPPAPGGTKNRVKLWAPPRSFTIYAANTILILNNQPVLIKNEDKVAYTNSFFSFQLIASDANNDPLTFTISGNPAWLTLQNNGFLSGTPAFSDTGTSTIIVTVTDNFGLSDKDTFNITVNKNFSPNIISINDTTIRATQRFEYQVLANDPDNDTIRFTFKHSPNWLSIGTFSGFMVGTPTVTDTGYFNIKIEITDGKGAFDSTNFILRVTENRDSIIATYGKPFIDGNINVGLDDWREEWLVIADSDSDSYWRPVNILDNEIIGIYSTWDADSLYIGVEYVINDIYNTLMLYIDAGLQGGITNFNSNQGYSGDYAKNFRFRPEDGIDFFTAAYYHNSPSLFKCSSNTSIDLSEKINSKRGANGSGSELAVAWNDLYELGTGLIPSNVEIKMVAIVAGGFNYGGGDSAPDNFDINGNAGPDSIIFLASIFPDKDGDGIPDPTIFITSEIDEFYSDIKIPSEYKLLQNYPNPFNPVTTIQYVIASQNGTKQYVQLMIYDILGNKVATLVDEYKSPGIYNILLEAGGLSSGIYFYKLIAGDFVSVRKMILLK